MIVDNHGQRLTVLVAFCFLIGLSSCNAGRDAEQPSPAVIAAEPDAVLEPATDEDANPGTSVVDEILPYAEVNEQLVYGYFAFPADMVEAIPAVILIHDRWGLDEQTRELSRRLAAEGYIVVAIDLFGGEVADSPGPARTLEIGVFENPQLAAENIRQAHRFVKDTFGSPRIASLGFGFGGGWSLNAAMLLPDELSASVIFYGQVTDDERKLATVQAAVLGLFGADDRVIPARSVLEFEKTLQLLDKNFEIEIFPGAGRGFADPRSKNFSAETTALAWVHTLKFLGQHLEASGT